MAAEAMHERIMVQLGSVDCGWVRLGSERFRMDSLVDGYLLFEGLAQERFSQIGTSDFRIPPPGGWRGGDFSRDTVTTRILPGFFTLWAVTRP